MTKEKLLAQGNTAEIYIYSADKVIKLFRKNMPYVACESEYYITSNVYQSLKICPKVYEQIDVDDRNGIVYERIVGKTLLNLMLLKMWKSKQMAKQMAQYHVDIQKEVTFELPSVHNKLKIDISAVVELEQKEKDVLYEYIDKLPRGNLLCHFDFHPGNIIMRDNQAVVIDWMTACRGDKLSDVARTGVMLKYADIPIKSKILKKIMRKFQNRICQEYLKEYISITGAQIAEIEKWEYPIMAARLREWVPKSEKQVLLKFVREYGKRA